MPPPMAPPISPGVGKDAARAALAAMVGARPVASVFCILSQIPLDIAAPVAPVVPAWLLVCDETIGAPPAPPPDAPAMPPKAFMALGPLDMMASNCLLTESSDLARPSNCVDIPLMAFSSTEKRCLTVAKASRRPPLVSVGDESAVCSSMGLAATTSAAT